MRQSTPYLPVSFLEAHASVRPQAPAVWEEGKVLTFGELLSRTRAIASKLLADGLARGEVVAVQLPNVWEYVAIELAVPLAGGVILPLPPSLGEAELAQAMQRSGAGVLVTGPAGEHRLARSVAEGLGTVRLSTTAAALCRPGPAPEARLPEPAADPDRVVEIALTSGTTGLPKLAALTAGLKQATFEAFTQRLEVTREDRVLVMSPVTQGIGGMCLYCLRVGASLVMLREARFTAEHTLRVAAASRATYLVGVPTNVSRMLASPELEVVDLGAARVTAVAGAPMPPEVARAWESRTGSRVCVFYGSMDAGQLAVARPSDPPDKRWTTVGRPHDSCGLMICGPSGEELPGGQVGEICMRGPTVQQRYWGEDWGPLAADGWAHMGDLGFVDAEGYLHVVGRLKDIIIRGGSNVNPYELESVLREHAGVQDVCVVGRPDQDLGERVVAFVVPSGAKPVSLATLREHLAARGIAKYKWPEFVELVDEIPLSGPGKVNRKALRERYESAVR